jgi:uncharacterized protein DUF5808
MRALTALAHRSIPLDDDRPPGLDPLEIGAGRCDDRVEAAVRVFGDVRPALRRLLGPHGIGLYHDDVPAGELERPRVDACEAELEHAAGPISQQLEDARRRGGGEGGRKPVHRYARYMSRKLTGKFLGIPYDWRRPTLARYRSRWWNPKDRRIVTPRAFGWGWDFNLYEVARRLDLRG